MTMRLPINLGDAPNSRNGDKLRTAFDKTEKNFVSLFAGMPIRPEALGGTNNAALIAARNEAIAAGSAIELTGLTYGDLGTTVDFMGVSIISPRGAQLLCAPQKVGSLKNIKLLSGENSSSSRRTNVPTPTYSGQFFFPFDDHRAYICSYNRHQRAYTVQMIRRNSGGSSGTDAGPYEAFRFNQVYDAYDVLGYTSVLPADGNAVYTGTGWAEHAYSAGVLGYADGNNPEIADNLKHISGYQTPTKGDYVDLNVEGDVNGKATLLFLASAVGSTEVNIYVDRGQGLGSITIGPELVTNGDFSDASGWNLGGGYVDAGSNIVSNGSFDSDTLWTKGAGWSIASGAATHLAGSATDIYQAIALAANTSYRVTVTVAARTAGSIRPKLSGGTEALGTQRTANATFTEYLANVDNGQIRFSAASGFDGSIDSVEVVPAVFTPSWAIGSGKATHPPTGASDLSRPLVSAPVVGQAYLLNYSVSGRNAGAVRPKLSGGATASGIARSANGVFTEIIVAGAGNTDISFSGASAFDGSIDDVSLRSWTIADAPPRMQPFSLRSTKKRFVSVEIELGCFGASRAVRVVNLGSGTLHLVAINGHRPQEFRPGITYPRLSIYRSPTKRHPINNDGAADFAIYSKTLNRIVGSYHGGEVKVEDPVWRVDGAVYTWEVGKPVACHTLTVEQHTLVGGEANVRTKYAFYDTGRLGLVTIDGGISETTELYLPMTTTATHYSQVTYPRFILLPIIGANDPDVETEHPLGQTDLVIQRDPDTGQEIWTYLPVWDDAPNLRGGAFIKANGRYKKLYYGPILGALQSFAGTTARFAQEFH